MTDTNTSPAEAAAAPETTKPVDGPMIRQVDGIGLVELGGTGPWTVSDVNAHNFDIKDATGAICYPTVTGPAAHGRGTKRNENVIFADRHFPALIVATFNLELATLNA